MTKTMTFLLAAFLLLALARKTQAYIDPGTGSYIIQLVIGGVLATLLAVKIYWTKLKLFFKRLFSGKRKDEIDSTDGK